MLWYMLILAVTLAIFSVLLYQNYKLSLYRNLDEILSSRAEGVVNALDAYREAERLWILENTQVRLKPNVLSKLNNVRNNTIAYA